MTRPSKYNTRSDKLPPDIKRQHKTEAQKRWRKKVSETRKPSTT